MRFRFNERKAAQAAAYLIKLRGGRLNYMKLIKLLYLADRRVLVERGRMITGDHMVSMPHGPVLSTVLDLINWGSRTPSPWSEYITTSTSYEVALARELETDELSKYELRILDEVDSKYGPLDKWALRDLTHDLPEWVDPDGSSDPIDPQTILHHEGKSQEEIRQLTHDAEDTYFLDLRSRPHVSQS
ncbi:MAG: SocA family protein [Deltaproteobacteria bacterium]|nr:SocA family protein [Deltaproteobacteria bacterium]MBI3389707.1 SocA family protein [Deltaproteobacteria bacterium]